MKGKAVMMLLTMVATLALASAVPGGWHDCLPEEADKEIESYFEYYEGARDAIKKAIGGKPEEPLKFVQASYQVVAGINMIAIAELTSGEQWHVSMWFQPGRNDPLLVQVSKRVDDRALIDATFDGAVEIAVSAKAL